MAIVSGLVFTMHGRLSDKIQYLTGKLKRFDVNAFVRAELGVIVAG